MKKIKVVALVGMPGAGKSVAADFFREKNVPVLRFGDQTDIGVKENGWELTPENERKYRENLRRELGMAAYAIKIEPRIIEESKTHDFIVLDGLYSWEEYIYLKNKIPELKLLCIYSSPEIRYSRLSTRKVRPLTPKQALERDVAELLNLNKGGPIAIADYLIINNDNNVINFKNELEKYYSTLI
jgi:dephospho-CoA kinase